jgi:hypothetical protein
MWCREIDVAPGTDADGCFSSLTVGYEFVVCGLVGEDDGFCTAGLRAAVECCAAIA